MTTTTPTLDGERSSDADSSTHTLAVKWMAKIGYASRGVVYLIIGGMALLAALGGGGATAGSRGALEKTLKAPGGWLVVLAIGIGLAGFSVWRFWQSALDADDHGTDTKGLTIRGGLFASCLTYLFLGVWAFYSVYRLMAGENGSLSTSSSGASDREQVTSWIMSQPFGRVLVAIIGLAFIGVGIAHAIKGHKDKFNKWFDWSETQRKRLTPVCTFGLYARSVVFLIIGGFFLYGAYINDPSQAAGIKEAMKWLREQPFGPWLFGVIAIGFMAFGAYSLIEAVYRRIAASDDQSS